MSWTRVLGGALPTILPDPEASAASLAGLYALRGHSSPDDPRQFAGAMIALGKSIPASTTAAFGALGASDAPMIVITSEAQVAAYNDEEQAEPLVAAYPTDGTVALDYPFVVPPATESSKTIETAEPESEEAKTKAELLDDLEAAIRAGTEVLATAGFRAADGTGKLDLAGVGVEAPPAETALDGAAQLEILRAWGVLTLRSRMLAVIDVSGSMEEPAESGLRRIDIFQQAAVGAMEKFSGEVELGVWIFSTARNGDLDYEDLAPIAPLADLAHKQQIAGIIQSLPDRLGGATGLYDATLAAVKRVRESYDPEKVNSVLLITDGKNEDRERHRARRAARRAQEDGRSHQARTRDHDRLRSRHRRAGDAADRPGHEGRRVLGLEARRPRHGAHRRALATHAAARTAADESRLND